MNADNANYPKTLMDAVRYFADPAVTHEFFTKLRWPTEVCCPHCGSVRVHYLANQRRWKCGENHPRRQFTVKIGTVMEESPLSLDKWAVAMWLEVNAKNSISSYELHRALGITQKSAWFMLHRIRFALQQGSFETKLGGVVEADETFIGGLAKNMHKAKRKQRITGTGGKDKSIVMGLLERHKVKGKQDKKRSRVVAKVVEDRSRETLHPIIHEHVEKDSTLYTDACTGYSGLSASFAHDFVDHVEAYVRGAVHTNGMENFWSLFKRCIKGTHIAVEPFHLPAYIDSEAFRFNMRGHTDGERFVRVMKSVEGKRLTYKALIGALEEAPASDRDEESEEELPN